jgi:outer membrane translocation and assembly module TamA
MLLLNLEYRFRLPVRILLDTYLRVRYDLGSISTVPEEIKLSTFRHGVGGEIAFDSPFGPAMVGAGKSFYFVRDLPEHPIRQGPVIFYFMIGYQL